MPFGAGPYIVAVCQKGGKIEKNHPTRGYARVLELIKHHKIPRDIIEHAPVMNMDDVKKILPDIDPEIMVKSVLVAVEREHGHSFHHEHTTPPEIFLIGVPATKKVDLTKFAKLIGKSRGQVRAATQNEVDDFTGFQVGNIPPFGLPKNIPIIMDSSIASKNIIWCGTGKATESLKVKVEDLKRLSAFTPADVSKPV